MNPELKKQKKLNSFWFVWNIIEAIVLFVGGVISIIFGVLAFQNVQNLNNIETVIAYVIASFVILDGVLRIVMTLARFKKGDDAGPLVVAGFEIAVGALLFLLQSKFAAEHIFTFTIVNFVSIILMVMGALILIYAIFVISKKMASLFMPIVEILFAAILIGVGVVIEVLYNTGDTREQLVLILTGSVLSLASVAMLIITIIIRRKAKRELEKAEAEERGDYEVADADHRISESDDNDVKPADIIDAEEVQHETLPHEKKKRISGPRAIDHKEE